MMIYAMRRVLRMIGILILSFAFIPFLRNKRVSQDDRREIDRQIKLKGLSDGVKVKLMPDGADSLKLRVAMLASAQKRIDVCYYRIKPNDKTSHIFYGALIEAARREIAINVVVDAKLGGVDKRYIALLSQYPTIKFYRYNPLSLKDPKGIQVAMHNKFLMVDESTVLTGGRNIGSEFFDPEALGTVISHDLEILIHDELGKSDVMQSFKTLRDEIIAFEKTRESHVGPLRNTKKLTDVVLTEYDQYLKETSLNTKYFDEVLSSAYAVDGIDAIHTSIEADMKEPKLGYAMLELARHSEGPMIFQTPYVTADKFILEAFERISKKRPVSMLTNSISSSPNFPAFSNYWAQRQKFVDTGISIREYQSNGKVSLHTKSYVFNHELAAVGTLNLDGRSLYINTETMIIVRSRRFVEELMQSIDSHCEKAKEIPVDLKSYYKKDVRNVPVWKRILMHAAGVVSRVFQRFV